MSQRIAFWRPYVQSILKTQQQIFSREKKAGLLKQKTQSVFSGDTPQFYPSKLNFKLGVEANKNALLKGQFFWAGQSLDVGLQGEPWTISLPSVDFARWLHGFDWIQDLVASKKSIGHGRAKSYIDSWILTYGKWNDFSWQTDILSRRLLNWLTIWTPVLSQSTDDPAEQRRRLCLYAQLKTLKANYKYSQAGIDRLRAAAVIAMGGAKLEHGGQAFLARGLDWLDSEIDQQILPDGGHVSRSPSASFEALKILLCLDGLLQDRGLEGSQIMSRAIDRLTPVIAFFQHRGGALANFHGGGNIDKAVIRRILNASPANAKSFSYCPHTGFQRMEFGQTVLLIDTGSAPKRPFDVQTHMAPLAIELSAQHGPIFVNCGWNPEQPKTWQRPVRAAAAHNTLILNNHSPGKLLPEGWKTRLLGQAVLIDSGLVHAQRKEQKAGAWLESNHQGYLSQYGLCHRRRLFMAMDGDDLRGEDSLYVPMGQTPLRSDLIPFEIRFHLHPNVKTSLSHDQHSALLVIDGKSGWRFRTDMGPLRIEPSVYLGDGYKPVKTEQLVISGQAYGDNDGEAKSNRVRWSLRELKSRSA